MRSPSAPAFAFVALIGTVAVAGCSAGHAAGRDKPPASPVTSTTESPQQLVLRGYAAAVQAITDAEVHNDPNWPGLFQTMVNPELEHVQAFIKVGQGLGYHSQGTSKI